jgi:hypothetical protein
MTRRRALLLVLLPVLFVGPSAFLIRAERANAAAAAAPANHDDGHYVQVRAQYIDLNGNRDETNTTLYLVNKSMTRTLVLGDVLAMGPNGLSEVLAHDGDLVGVAIPPLGTIELPVDSAHFPGLLPELEVGQRGLESVVLSFAGPKDALGLTASIHLQQPGNLENRVITLFEGNDVEK